MFRVALLLGIFAFTSCGGAPTTTQTAVKSGLEVLADRNFDTLRGKRVGLIINQTSQLHGRSIVDVMIDAEIDVRALFGPEHGIRGQAEAGEKVSNAALDSIPIYSLYGSTRKPPADVLAGLDVLIFDIQDVGARFYTYIATMGQSMQAAADAGIPFIVLDRPNPLGGEYVAGWIAEEEHRSFVAPYPIPVVHGLTVGELAKMIKGEEMLEGMDSLDLQVVRSENLTRQMQWHETGLEWIATSPNIPTFETALIYAGTCFFEGTTLSEGRGTPAPFLTLGAPGIDGGKVLAGMDMDFADGVSVQSTTFMPEDVPGVATNVKHKGQLSSGVSVSVDETALVDPLALGMSLLVALVREGSGEVTERLNERWLTRLAGTRELYDLVSGGATAKEIVESWSADVEKFRKQRQPYLLY